MTTGKPVLRRAQAQEDIADAIAFYLDQGTLDAAHGFVIALQSAIGHIGGFPTSGSPRYAVELSLPDPRFWRLKRYPYLIFYVERDDHIDVWRMLHDQRDIPARLREPE